MLSSPNPDRSFRSYVRFSSGDKWHKIYEGRWTEKAYHQYKNHPAIYKRIVAVLTDAEVTAVINDSPSLALLGEWLDGMYSLPGDVGDEPNRAEV